MGAIQAYTIHKGKEEARKLFMRTVTSRLKAWADKKLAISLGMLDKHLLKKKVV